MTNSIANNWLGASKPQAQADQDIALVLSGDGAICSILHASVDAEPNDAIESFWAEDVCDRVRSNLRRALRSRHFFTEELTLDAQGECADFTYIAQGRDRVLLLVRNTSQHQQTLSQLKRLAFVDTATALPNREYFLGELEKIVEYQRLREGRTAVIGLHIRDFGLRHGAVSTADYDAVLHELGVRLVHELRGANSDREDDYERRSIVARSDFQRFSIILPEIESGSDAESVTERLTLLLQTPVEVQGKTYRAEVHAGIALFPQDGGDGETLFANANAATEEARTGQDGDVRFHSGTVKLRTLQRQDLEVELRSALDRGAFALNYLPIVDAASGAVRAVEALLRWPESVMGSHSTGKVIGLAERTGLIVPIGEWVLQESFDQLKTWQDEFDDDLRLSVNLSMQEFSRPEIATRMAALMLQVGVQPSSVDLEITEKMLGRDAIAGYRAMDALKALGVGLIVDDFGTGACSLTQFAHSPVDGIKIDISLVKDIETSERDFAACGAAISSAHALALTVVAEGVESAGQADLLQQRGCDYLQGFYFAKPLEADAMRDFLRTSLEDNAA